MNWILALVGALFGVAIAQSKWLLGAVLGFMVMFLIGSVTRLRHRLDALERELELSRSLDAEPIPPDRATAIPARVAAAAPQQAEIPAATLAAAAVAAQSTPATEVAAPAMDESIDAAASVSAPAPATMPPSPPPSRGPDLPREPGWPERLTGAVKRWFTEGNVPVKVGVLVLFFGIAAALRFAVAQGYFQVPIELRLALIAGGGLAGLLLGWRERERRPAFGLSLQGGGIGVLLMTVFAAYRMYSLLPSTAAFGLIVALVAGSALLAVLQDAVALAALGFLGGYLAPVLISTGSHDHVALFSYYAVLNAAVFGVSWKRSWRLLNLIGFAFTFGVGTVWGVKFYRPELFASVEPFLILFFMFYVAIGLLYVIRQTEHRRPWVDGSLVFGTPLLAFPLQAGLLKDDHMGLAISALVVAVTYFGLVWWLRRRRDERLLTEAYAALALCFSTLAIPLAFSTGTTASVWALEGAGVAWLGIRQNRTFPWIAGLALQLLAAGAWVYGELDRPGLDAHADLLLLNPAWLGAALIAVGGYVLNFVHDRLRPIRFLPALLFAWATIWWLAAGATQLDLADGYRFGEWRFCLAYFSATIALAAVLRKWLPWPRLGRLVALCAGFCVIMPLAYDHQLGGPLAPAVLGLWAAYAVAMLWTLWSTREESSRSLAVTHVLGLWTIVFAACVQADHMATVWKLANGWEDAFSNTPLLFATLLLLRKPEIFAWPRAQQFAGYRIGWFAPAALLLAFIFVYGLVSEGAVKPLPFVPILNPLELSLIANLALLYALCPDTMRAIRKAWPYLGFALVTSATLRAVHHLHGEPWTWDVFDSGVSQMALTLVWSLLGVTAWIVGSRTGNRRLWLGGALLMGVVLLKLVALDRHYMGDMPGIASFVVVGLLMVGVGYIAPSPPKPADSIAPEAIPPDAVPGTDKVEAT